MQVVMRRRLRQLYTKDGCAELRERGQRDDLVRVVLDTAGEFDGRESYAAPALGAKEAKVDCRVLARGRSVSQASTRTMFMAMAVTTC